MTGVFFLERVDNGNHIIAILRNFLLSDAFDQAEMFQRGGFLIGDFGERGIMTDHKIRDIDGGGFVLAPDPEGGEDLPAGVVEIRFGAGGLFFGGLGGRYRSVIIKDEDGPIVRIAGDKLRGGFFDRHGFHKGIDGDLILMQVIGGKAGIEQAKMHDV